MPIDLRFGPDEAPLMIDLYELTMAASYYRIGFDQPACFYLSVRRMPPKRGFLVAAGIERVLEALEDFHFGAAAIEYLDSLKLFTPEFLTYLSTLRFTGDVYASLIPGSTKVATAKFLTGEEPKWNDNSAPRVVLSNWVASPRRPRHSKSCWRSNEWIV